MKKKSVFLFILLGVILICAIGGICIFRERSLESILPLSPEDGVILRWDWQNSPEDRSLTENQKQTLMDALAQLKYKKLSTQLNLGNSYASVMYTAEGRLIELIFSQEKGGTLLVNDLEGRNWKPVYQILPDGFPIYDLLESFTEG